MCKLAKRRITALSLLFVLLQSCQPAIPVRQIGVVTPSPLFIQAAEYDQKIDQVQSQLAKATVSEQQADLHLQLGRLLSSYNNPERDYARALGHFESFTRLDKKTATRQEIQDWLLILREYNEMSSRNTDCLKNNQRINTGEEKIGELEAELIVMRSSLDEARKENKELKKTIEKLKFLDLTLEEKRKNYK